MTIAERTAVTSWTGDLAQGHGTVHASSGAFDALPVTWAGRTERPDGRTSPEELAASAHSSCFSMALALRLGKRQMVADWLSVSATVTLDEVDGLPTVTSSALQVRAKVPGLDSAGFQSAIAEAAALCPVSRLFAGAEISVTANLVQALQASTARSDAERP